MANPDTKHTEQPFKVPKGFRRTAPAPWVDVWREHYYRDRTGFKEAVDQLLEGLDTKSCEEIRATVSRFIEIVPPTGSATEVYVRNKQFLTQLERRYASQKRFEAAMKAYETRHPDYKGLYMPRHSVLFHAGLRSMPKRVSKRLSGSLIVDGGACWGDSASVLSCYEPEKILSCEPDPTNHSLLKEMMKSIPVVEPMPVALGESQGFTRFFTQGRDINIGASVYRNANASKEVEVKVETIDELVSRYPDLDVSLIKLDIEGAELGAIKGAAQTIQKFRPALSIAIYHHPDDFLFIKPFLKEIVPDYHFRVVRYNPGQVFGLFLLAY